MKKLLSILFVIALIVLIIPIKSIDPTPGYNPNYCLLWSNDADRAIITCKLDGLGDPSGLFINNLDLNHTYVVNVYRYYSIQDNAYKIHFLIAQDPNPRVILDLPLTVTYMFQNGSVLTPRGWAFRITYYLNNTYYQQWVYIYPENYTTVIPLPPGAVITEVVLKVAQENVLASPPPIPDWYNIPGWIMYLSYLVKQFAVYIPVAISMLVLVADIFLKLSATLIVIIPLSIIAGLLEGVDTAMKVINFWFSLFKKLYDIFMKIVHIIISLIQALKPV